ncbi:MAG: glucose-6-phosphate dehydrogenase [Faecalicatena sp.]|uniref:glucose-6-phosphate dehydrogenase n=1 Tax=Faecalicatena sp. TaxID=2005360 RepID=UPI00258E7ED4|nr:glucose-6-phosphate dehydrogenase [Faecalicatena sp.]MCI6464106.1 glucose-6-phosphate dehydrogenase [Faecalicatena sp.]MDY5619168.1 glucose-6-phosphate dehydrogenase [Lachnospiraceae bacterium]
MKIHTNITIFGGTGDLTFRKLLPALYTMYLTKKLPKDSRIVIIGRRDYDSDSYRLLAEEWVDKFTRLPYTKEDFSKFSKLLAYFRMDLSNQQDYQRLNEYFSQDDITSHIFYLAVAPRFFTVIADGLETVCGACHGKVIIEKPFGENLEAAEKLNQQLERHFGSEQIYRIDHYLGKEMVRNIQAIRFTNPIFTDVWNSRYIESVQISALEDVGVETRGGYYDASGALKDMVQNHLFQILSIVAMERPEVFNSTQMHQEQLNVLRSLRPASEASIEDTLVLGQYEGYREEPLVSPDSSTETFAGLRLFIDNERWSGTPFYIRTGKKTGTRQMEVSIVFRRSMPEVEPDILTIKIQPTEGVYLQFNIKRPGDTEEIIPTKMDFCQNCNIIHQLNTPEAYERLLTACIAGERSWFSQWDQIEISWNYIEQLKQLFKEKNLPVYPYAQGIHGPKEAEEFLEKAGHRWIE